MADTDTIDTKPWWSPEYGPPPELTVEKLGPAPESKPEPPPAPQSPPELTRAQRAQEAVVRSLERRIADAPEEERRVAESQAREDELRRQQLEFTRRSNDEQIRDIEAQRKFREEHPRPTPPTIPPPPQFHLTPPPGLFGDNNTPQGQNAPGNQWMQAVTMVGALGSGTDRRSAMAAMAAMTGMLKGWAKGEKDEFDAEFNNWKNTSQTVVQNYERQRDYYNDVLGDNKLSMEEKKQEIALRAGEFKDAITQELAVQGHFDKMDKHQEELAKIIKDYADATGKFEKSVTDGLMDQPGIRFAAERALMGDLSYIRSYRAGSPERKAADNVVAQRAAERNIPMDEITRREAGFGGQMSGARTQANVAARTLTQLDIIERRLQTLIPDVYAASEALPRGRWVPVNRAVQAWQSGTSDLRLAAFGQANFDLAETYAKAKNPTGVLQVGLQNFALERLSTATSRQAYATVLNQIVREIYRSIEAAKGEATGAPVELPSIPGAYVPPGQKPLLGQAAPGSYLEQLQRQFPGATIERVQ